LIIEVLHSLINYLYIKNVFFMKSLDKEENL